jgi:hypothetical protein
MRVIPTQKEARCQRGRTAPAAISRRIPHTYRTSAATQHTITAGEISHGSANWANSLPGPRVSSTATVDPAVAPLCQQPCRSSVIEGRQHGILRRIRHETIENSFIACELFATYCSVLTGVPAVFGLIPRTERRLDSENSRVNRWDTVVNILRSMCLLTVSALVACSSSDSDWKKADARGSEPAYRKFLTDHPNDPHAEQARSRVQALQDEQAWTQATKANTVDGFRQYVQMQPMGLHTTEAREQAADLERAAAWKSAQASANQAALHEFLERYPQGSEAEQAQTQLEKLETERFHVQLAAFRSQSRADRARTQLQSKYGNVLREVVITPATLPGELNRVISAPMTLDSAKSACAMLNKARQHCEVVKG